MNLKNWLTLTIRTVDFNLVAKQPDLVARLRELTLAPHSGLNYELTRMLKDAQEREVKCKIILAYRFRQVVGWAICSKEDSSFCFTVGKETFKSTDGYMFQVYVEPKHRRGGIASEMYKEAVKIAGDEALNISAWDNGSHHFYSSFPDINRKNL
jgi:ribosomal protein S18 acetylase RimI-like enzyme